MRSALNKQRSVCVLLIMIRILLVALLLGAGVFAQQPSTRQFLIRIEPVRAGFTLSNISPEERPVLAAHGAYLRQLLAEGKLVLAGQAFPGDQPFGIIVIEAPDAATAQATLDSDPAVKGNVFRGQVIPFRTLFQRNAVKTD